MNIVIILSFIIFMQVFLVGNLIITNKQLNRKLRQGTPDQRLEVLEQAFSSYKRELCRLSMNTASQAAKIDVLGNILEERIKRVEELKAPLYCVTLSPPEYRVVNLQEEHSASIIQGGCGRSAGEVRFSARVVAVCLGFVTGFVVVVGVLRYFGMIGGN